MSVKLFSIVLIVHGLKYDQLLGVDGENCFRVNIIILNIIRKFSYSLMIWLNRH